MQQEMRVSRTVDMEKTLKVNQPEIIFNRNCSNEELIYIQKLLNINRYPSINVAAHFESSLHRDMSRRMHGTYDCKRICGILA
jgi:hypothetical protein